MAAATAPINTPERFGGVVSYPVAAATNIYAGTLVAVNTSGQAVPAADAANLKVVGRAEADALNGSGAAGDLSVPIKRGTFRFANSGSDAVDADDVQKVCYVADDTTVREGTGTNSIKAGLVLAVDADGVWVDTALAQAI